MTLAWVTGASRGIGRATALALAQRRVDLILLARGSRNLSDTASQVRALGCRVSEATVDLAEAESTVRICAELLSQHGVPDVAINNAGVVRRQPVEQLSVDAWQHQIDVNLRAPFLICRELLPAMRARGSGRLIQVGSISSTIGSPNASAYCAAKWGLVGFTKSLAEELHDSGVMTLAVLPGSVDTDMLEGSGFAARMSAADVASTLVHYALDAPAAHNGAVIEMFGV